MTVNGEITSPPEIDAGLAAAALAVFAHRHEVVHLLYAATDEPDALARIAALLHVDESTISRVLDQPFRWMLPQFRAELQSLATTPPTHTPPPSPAEPTTTGALSPPTTPTTTPPTSTPTSTPADGAGPGSATESTPSGMPEVVLGGRGMGVRGGGEQVGD